VEGLSCDHNGDVFFTGYTASSSGITTPGSYESSSLSNGYATFLGKLSADTSVRINQPFTDTLFCAGASFTLNYTVNNSFDAGNIFTAQLSDTSGNFSNPITIGSVSAVSAGTITCVLPGNAQGTGYRVRIYASNPADTSDDDRYNIQIDTSGSASVSISSVPAVPVGGQSAIFTATVINGGTAPTYQWRKNGVNIPGATANPYTGTFSSGDKISVLVYSNRPCTSPDSATSNSDSVVALGVNNFSNESGNINVFPNPNEGSFTIKGPVKNGNYSIEMTNVLGQIVYSSVVSIDNALLETQVKLAIPAGVYSLQINDHSGQPIIKQVVIGK
jgi:hypothetical protein